MVLICVWSALADVMLTWCVCVRERETDRQRVIGLVHTAVSRAVIQKED